VGTSGSYGGSGNSAWQTARERFDQLLDSGSGADATRPEPAAGTGETPAAGEAGTDETPAAGEAGTAQDAAVAAAAAAIAAALSRDDPDLRARMPRAYSLPSLLPGGARGGGSGGGGGAGGGHGASRGVGRTGDGSRRAVGKGVQRGASALAAGYALRTRDREALRELNLDLDELEALGGRQRCDRILAAVLGDGNHPDEYALRRAASEQLKAIVMGDQPPTVLEAIQDFISGFVFQLGLLELRAQRKAGLDAGTVAGIERSLKRWLQSRVRGIRAGLTANIPVAEIRDAASRVAQEAIRIVRAGVPRR